MSWRKRDLSYEHEEDENDDDNKYDEDEMKRPIFKLSYLRERGYRTYPIFHVNGRRISPSLAKLARPNQTLLSYLRDVLQLTGTKLGCAEGGCGACTVLVSRYDPNDGDEDHDGIVADSDAIEMTRVARRKQDDGIGEGNILNGKRGGKVRHYAVNACLAPVLSVDGCHVTTVEGIGTVKGGLHPVQRAMVEMHGSQCGFCTPGIVVSIYALLAENPTVTHIEEHLDGNLCRCTGYRPIWDAARSLCVVDGDGDGDVEDVLGVPGYCGDSAGGLAVDLRRGPCGTLCRACPERERCKMERNVDDEKAKAEAEEVKKKEVNEVECSGDEEEKKVDATARDRGASSSSSTCERNELEGEVVCVSTSADKVRAFRAFLDEEEEEENEKSAPSWRSQPEDSFPKGLSDPRSDLYNEASRPLAIEHRIPSGRDGGGGGGGVESLSSFWWIRPESFPELLRLLSTSRDDGEGCKIVVGNTEVGIEAKFKGRRHSRLICPSPRIRELHTVEVSVADSRLSIGACAPLTYVLARCEELCSSPRHASSSVRRIASPIRDMLRWFASTQIRNVACLGGNLATASPISDMNPLLAALGAELVVSSLSSSSSFSDDNGSIAAVRRRRIPVPSFFQSYRTVDLRPDELIESIEVPLAGDALEYAGAFKQARRREDDISIVSAGMRIRLAPEAEGVEEVEEGGRGEGKEGFYVVRDIVLSFGGMAPTTIVPVGAASTMIGRPFCEETFVAAGKELISELRLPDDVPGGQAQYRMTLAASFLRRFYLQVVEQLEEDISSKKSSDGTSASGAWEGWSRDPPPAPAVKDEERSGAPSFLGKAKPRFRGAQRYPATRAAAGLERHRTDGKVGEGGKGINSPAAPVGAAATKVPDAVGKPSPHASAPLHCTGEALYTDDVPLPPNSLHGVLVLADRCHDRFVSMDAAPALGIPEVVAVYSYADVLELGGDNAIGPIQHDETVFLPPGEKVAFVGQVLGICVGESLEAAERGARAVEVTYGEEEGEPVMSIEQAISADSFYEFARHKLERGDVDSALAAQDSAGRLITVSGSFRCGGQEHFYLETNSTLALPSESGTNLTIYCSTQAPTKTQMFCASCTGTQASRVVVRMKRMGGGFGGKETRSVFVSCAAAVAAKRSDRPVRLTLDRDVDMSITGGRHSFLAKYRASAQLSSDGKTATLHALDVKLFSNGGSAFDLSGPVIDRALFHVDGCYNWPNFRAEGVPCKTAQAPHTAFRGFGGPQGMTVCEHIMDHLSHACGVPGDVLRRRNMYDIGHSVPFGMVMGESHSGRWNVPLMWDRMYRELDVAARRAAVDDFNKRNKWVKRGLSFIPTKFGIAFTAKFMNQGGALVHLYTDGTVLVTHGGTEMGQGLHTKVCQMAAQAFGIDLRDVYINDTSTDKIANTIPTAASMSTDMYGMATLDACRKILERIEPVRQRLGPDASLKDIAQVAHMERIDLSAHGFFALDDKRCGYDWAKPKPLDYPPDAPANAWKGHPFNYFTQGVACTEVEIDVLSGNHRTISSDVLIDVGSSVNPVIDIGQVEGAFIQGMGWSTIEEVIISDGDHTWIRPRGKVFTAGPGTYKIPAFNDVPESFRVSLLEDAKNPFAVHSSKAVGEPPFFLGCSVFYAIKDAVTSARAENFSREYFEMRMPATSERIRMMCADDIAVDGIGGKTGSTRAAVASYQPKGSH